MKNECIHNVLLHNRTVYGVQSNYSGYNGIEIEVQLLLMKVAKVDCFRLFLLFAWHVFSILLSRPSTSSVPARDCV